MLCNLFVLLLFVFLVCNEKFKLSVFVFFFFSFF